MCQWTMRQAIAILMTPVSRLNNNREEVTPRCRGVTFFCLIAPLFKTSPGANIPARMGYGIVQEDKECPSLDPAIATTTEDGNPSTVFNIPAVVTVLP